MYRATVRACYCFFLEEQVLLCLLIDLRHSVQLARTFWTLPGPARTGWTLPEGSMLRARSNSFSDCSSAVANLSI